MLQSREVLSVIEESLVGHRAFGDSAYILEQFQTCSKRRLSVIAGQLPSAGRLLDALQRADRNSRYRVLANTVVRSAIQHAHVTVETGSAYGLPRGECDEIFEASARHLKLEEPRTPFESSSFSLPRLGEEPHYGWIWREDYPHDIFGRSFRFLVSQNWGDLPGTPSDDDIVTVKKGVRLLHTLMPLLAKSALSHVQVVGIFDQGGGWRNIASSSQFKVGGAIFLSRSLLRNPWTFAEHLLHEALHHKLYDFRHGHTLLEAGASRKGALTVTSPWNPENLDGANQWDTHRAYAAFHVYVQLFVLSLIAKHRAAELEPLYGPADGMIESRRAYERAWYLGEQLKGASWDLLGLAGQRMVDWLISILEELEPSSPPSGAHFHLELDLYSREGRSLQSAPSVISNKLERLAKEEIERTRQILSTIHSKPRLDQFNEDIRQFPDNELGSKFSGVREVVASTLRKASPDGYRLTSATPGSEDPDDLVRQMVLKGSERLYAILRGIPETVAAAKQRAFKQRFNQSCLDEVGRLLAVLTASVPKGGRILEIGTGVGVGTAWITSGLGGRTDVEVISVEVDRQLGGAAMQWPWPANVRVMIADVLEVMGTLETFHLVFVDASPVKHGHIESIIKLLRPGGFLLVDDLHVGKRVANPEEQQSQQDTLRRLLFHHPELQAVELDCSSGMILATRGGGGGPDALSG